MTRNRTSIRKHSSLILRPLLATAAIIAVAAPASAGTTASPMIANQASSSGFPVGISIYDSVTLGNGNNPTGTLTFRLYSPADPGCTAAPIFTTSVAAQGNGYYQSASFRTDSAGTYRWTASYSGDANNLAPPTTPCDATSAQVMVAKRTPTYSATASLLSLGGPTVDSAVLNGAGPYGPTGTITFKLYGPGDLMCAGSPAFTSTKFVAGNGTYSSDPFTPPAAGTYQWTSIYSGDSNNNPAGTICSDLANSVIATGTSLSFSVTPLSISPAKDLSISWSGIAHPSATDWIALYAVGAPDSAVRAWRYTNGAASGSATLRIPWGTPPGAYEIRLFCNNSYSRLATSSTITVL